MRCWSLTSADKSVQHYIDVEIARQISTEGDSGGIEFSLAERTQDGVSVISLVQMDITERGAGRLTEWARFRNDIYKLEISGASNTPDTEQAVIQARAALWGTTLQHH